MMLLHKYLRLYTYVAACETHYEQVAVASTGTDEINFRILQIKAFDYFILNSKKKHTK